jgi:TPR repeat protein
MLGPKETVTPAATIITSPAPGKLSSETAFSAAEIAALLARGDWLFATGDVASARLLYQRAADAGVARAAVRLGETFDPVFSGPPHLRGLDRDSSIAAFWYSRARDLGATGVASRLKSLETRSHARQPGASLFASGVSLSLANVREALVGVGSSATEEAPWSPQGQVALNVGSQRSSRPMSPAIRA